jgi:hypothetical protein
MSDTDFSAARSGLSNALSVIAPVLTALQQAEQVFGVLQNADKHSKALAKEVATQQQVLGSLKAQAVDADTAAKAILAGIPALEKEAEARTAAALAAEKKAVADAKKAATESIGVAQAKAYAEIAKVTTNLAEAQQAAEVRISTLIATELELGSVITALEAKLDKLKAQAQKFAAALTAD